MLSGLFSYFCHYCYGLQTTSEMLIRFMTCAILQCNSNSDNAGLTNVSDPCQVTRKYII